MTFRPIGRSLRTTRLLRRCVAAGVLFCVFVFVSYSPATSSAADPETPPSFGEFEQGAWILLALFQGDVEKLYKSDDLGGVFIYVIALHKTFGERAPDLYDDSAHLQLAEAFIKFGISGHNIENVLDAFLNKPEDFIGGAVKTAITEKSADWEAKQFLELFGTESFVAKRVETGISKFASGAMAALEAKYRPKTDGILPPNVSEEQFAKDPTIGKQQIVRFNDVYKYYDAEIITKHPGWNRYASGYTLSRTPPNAEAESIEEWYTIFKGDVWDNGEIISRGRTIPRAKVVPVPAVRGEYLDLHGDRVFGEAFYYSPPSTASAAEQRKEMATALPEPSTEKPSLVDRSSEATPTPSPTPTPTSATTPAPTPYPGTESLWVEREHEARQDYAKVWITLPQAKRDQLREAEIDFNDTVSRFAPPERIRAIRNRIEYFRSLGAKE
jgi:hypothetical protein